VIQNMEGYRTSRLAWGTASARPLTIGFWTNHQRSGVYSVVIQNELGNRCYVATYTQANSATSQYNVITIPGDTTGTWGKINDRGMTLSFAMAAGTTYTAPAANTWLSGSYWAAPGQVNGVVTTGDVFRLTGVVVLPGIEAPSAERSPLIMRPYDQELVTCQRYWQQLGQKFSGRCESTTRASGIAALIQPMRAAPTVSLRTANATSALVSNTTIYTVTSISGVSPALESIYFAADVSAATLVFGQAVTGFATNWINCDARL